MAVYGFSDEDVRRIREVIRVVEGGVRNPDTLRGPGPRGGGGSTGQIVRIREQDPAGYRFRGWFQGYDEDTDTLFDLNEEQDCWLRITGSHVATIDTSGESCFAALAVSGATYAAPGDGGVAYHVYISICC